MKRLVNTTLVAFCLILIYGSHTNVQAQKYPERRLGWKLGAQAYTFNRFTFFEAVDKIKSCGLKYVEAFPGQDIGGGIDGKMDFGMSAEKRSAILSKLKSSGVALLSYGVISPKQEDDWKQLFAFAKAMGIKTITSEPNPAQLSFVSALCDEYEIDLAIHNHPKPSRYWDPDVVLSAISGKSKRIGVCADIGHWVRSGLDPVACLKKLEGHIIQLHFKDLNECCVREAHDVVWGQGVCDIKGVMRELKSQGFKGLFSAEYEYKWDNNVPEVSASVVFFRDAVKNLK